MAMIPVPAFHGSKIAVLGLARSGLAAARSLAQSGAEVIAWDDTPARRAAASDHGIAIVDLNDHDWAGTRGLVLSPGIPIRLPRPHPVVAAAQRRHVPVFGDVEVFARARAALPAHRLVGITGTNGKSTTTALIGHILSQAGREVAVGGNIGTAVMGLQPLPAGGIYVFELSSYQIEQTLSLAADVAVLLNITPDHLDRHGDMQGYAAAKAHLFAMQKPSQTAIVALDDGYSRAIAKSVPARLIAVSGSKRVKDGVYVKDGALVDARLGKPRTISRQADWPALIGIHNAQNAAAAAAVALALDVDAGAIDRGLRSFAGLAHRLQPVATWRGIRFINDSKATNTDAAATALASFEQPVHWIVGGRAKAKGLGAIRRQLGHVAKAYLVGEAAPLFARLLAPHVPVTDCGSIDQAVKAAAADCGQGGGIVLLAPACASFDQYADFEARGDAFKAAVQHCIGEADA